MGEEDAVSRAGEPHVEEASLFGQCLLIELAAKAQRQQPVFAADHEDHRELQPLRCVKGEQGDSLGAWIPQVDLRTEAYLVEESYSIAAAATKLYNPAISVLGRFILSVSFSEACARLERCLLQ